MLGALVCAVVGLLLALIVTVFVRAWPSFSHNGLAWFGAGGNVDEQINAIFLSGQAGAELRLHLPRLAADLEHDPDHRRRRRCIALFSARSSSPSSSSSSRPSG